MSKKTTDLTVKAIPVAADTMTGLDSEDVNLTTKDKAFTIDSIGTTVFGDRSTDDLVEGTNEYYTEAKVSANTTVVGKADKTNVLELDNTVSYTPTADFHPATKNYVDTMPVPSATTEQEGIVERATDAEAIAGIDTTRYMSPKQVKDVYIDNFISTESTTIIENQSDTFNVPSNCNVILIDGDSNSSVLTRNGKVDTLFSSNGGDADWNTGTDVLTVNSNSGTGTYFYRVYYYVTL